jgi:hypothetical protein
MRKQNGLRRSRSNSLRPKKRPWQPRQDSRQSRRRSRRDGEQRRLCVLTFERLAAEEHNQELKAELAAQARAYRKLVAERAKHGPCQIFPLIGRSQTGYPLTWLADWNGNTPMASARTSGAEAFFRHDGQHSGVRRGSSAAEQKFNLAGATESLSHIPAFR